MTPLDDRTHGLGRYLSIWAPIGTSKAPPAFSGARASELATENRDVALRGVLLAKVEAYEERLVLGHDVQRVQVVGADRPREIVNVIRHVPKKASTVDVDGPSGLMRNGHSGVVQLVVWQQSLNVSRAPRACCPS